MFGFSSGKKKKNALNISLKIISIPFNIEFFFFFLLLLLWSLETFFQQQPTHPIRLRTTRGKSNYFSIIPSRQYIFPGKRNKKEEGRKEKSLGRPKNPSTYRKRRMRTRSRSRRKRTWTRTESLLGEKKELSLHVHCVSGWRTIRIYVERPGKQSQNHKIRKEARISRM